MARSAKTVTVIWMRYLDQDIPLSVFASAEDADRVLAALCANAGKQFKATTFYATEVPFVGVGGVHADSVTTRLRAMALVGALLGGVI